MRPFIYVALIALGGCGGGDYDPAALSAPATYPCGDPRNAPDSDPRGDNHGCGFLFDAQAAGGLKVRNVSGKNDPLLSAAFFQSRYDALETCTGLHAPPPFVVIVPPGVGSLHGLYFKGPPLIVVEWRESPPTSAQFLHLAKHHLLDVATGDPDLEHGSAIFRSCIPVF